MTRPKIRRVEESQDKLEATDKGGLEPWQMRMILALLNTIDGNSRVTVAVNVAWTVPVRSSVLAGNSELILFVLVQVDL